MRRQVIGFLKVMQTRRLASWLVATAPIDGPNEVLTVWRAGSWQLRLATAGSGID